jgi:serine/threonine protein kinase
VHGLPVLLPSQVCVDVCDGLRFCHSDAVPGEVILHRDLKPENILLRRDAGSGKLVAALGDFGISKLYPVEEGARTVNLVGTPGYDKANGCLSHLVLIRQTCAC